MSFSPQAIESFVFGDYSFDRQSGQLELHYRLDDIDLVERYLFPGAPFRLEGSAGAYLEQALQQLHLAAGISYYKAALPARIELGPRRISAASAACLTELYRQGLAEFAYRNQLQNRLLQEFPARPNCQDQPIATPLARRTAVPLGGGKDSLVTVEALRAANEPLLLLVVGRQPSICAVAAATGLPFVNIERQLDPKLFELNRWGAYNGHVPITAILSFLFAAAAVLYDYDTIAMSNEKSADEANRESGGEAVNHQYSKSLAAEELLAEHFSRVLGPTLCYFSFLRPLSELAIARCFARLPRYHSVFTSCNGAFRLQTEEPKRWCLDCPKCRFVFLALAPFLPKPELCRIFDGLNLLADPGNWPGFAELIGLGAGKPFECVGEVAECQTVIRYLARQPEWANDAVVRSLNAQLPQLGTSLETYLKPATKHRLPPRYEEALNAYLRS